MLARELQPEGGLPEQRLVLVERVHRQRAAVRRPALAGGQGIGVPIAGDDEVCSVGTDPVHFGR